MFEFVVDSTFGGLIPAAKPDVVGVLPLADGVKTRMKIRVRGESVLIRRVHPNFIE
ncbi:MAG: hypothetical protein ACI8Y4_003988 [Candidatus Poriferisodalaceae bacterium]|jgi:hypothetical protein